MAPDSLRGRKIALTEHRFERELAKLVERHGGEVVSCPLLEECVVDNLPELESFVRELIDPGLDMMIFFTGVGFRFLHEQAVRIGEAEAFLRALGRTRIVARGPKPHAALRRVGVRLDMAPEIPTSEGLLDLLRAEDLGGRHVGVQLYGVPNDAFCRQLEAWGAKVKTVQVYEYRAVSDAGQVARFIDRLVGGEIDAVTFTSAPQVVSLFGHADRLGKTGALTGAMTGPVVVVAIGGVTNRALSDRGVPARVVPAVSKMGAMVEAIAGYFGP